VTKVNFVDILLFSVFISSSLEIFLSSLNLLWLKRGTGNTPPSDRERQTTMDRTSVGVSRHLTHAAAFVGTWWAVMPSHLLWAPRWDLIAAVCLRTLTSAGLAAWEAYPSGGLRTPARKAWAELLPAGIPALGVGLAAGDGLLPWGLAAAIGWAASCFWRELSISAIHAPCVDTPPAFVALVARAGLHRIDIHVKDDAASVNRPNARAEGIGPFRRIVIDKGLTDLLTTPQATAVIAHEAGHLAHRHRELFLAWRLIQGWACLGLAAMFWAGESSAALLVLALPNLAFLAHPLDAAFVRRWEFQADRYAAAQVGGSAMKAALERIFALHAAPASPLPLYAAFHTLHPAPAERLRRLGEER
jgi:Zn-dependent protease with chaperone function